MKELIELAHRIEVDDIFAKSRASSQIYDIWSSVTDSGFTMAEKISTLILKVDLECYRCYKEIRRILCKLQDKENIKTISYEEKSNTVIISGPFDPQKLSKMLRCKAGKVIKDVQIKELVKEKDIQKEKPKEAKPAESTPKEKEKPKEAKPAEAEKEKPKETKPAEPEKEKRKPSEPPKEENKPEKEDKPAEKPKKEQKPAEQEKKPEKEDKPANMPEPKPEPAKNEPVQVTATQPFFEPGPVCCPAPYYEGYSGGCRCCACGHILVVGPGSYGPGPCGPVYDGRRVYHFFSEEDPSTSSCSIM
ncbi:hypothetical protein LUZ60_004598 [Juncus effusus]|nr:hypothetical protein LUZ60_004598 [Juncus effusus]